MSGLFQMAETGCLARSGVIYAAAFALCSLCVRVNARCIRVTRQVSERLKCTDPCAPPSFPRPVLRWPLSWGSTVTSSFLWFPEVMGPPIAGAFRERPQRPTAFRKFYERGDFPIALEHDSKGNRIAWKVGPSPTPARHIDPARSITGAYELSEKSA